MAKVKSVNTKTAKSDAEEKCGEVFWTATPVAFDMFLELPVAQTENFTANCAVCFVGGMDTVAVPFMLAIVLPVIR